MTRQKVALWASGAIVGAFLLLYLLCVHILDQHHVGLRYNLLTGEMTLDAPGVYVTPPWVRVSRIDVRPQRVCLTTVAKVLICKLVRFQPSEYKAFVAREGFRAYWWDNRISFNLGYFEEYRGLRDIFRGYAFEPGPHPFLVDVTN